MPEIKALYHSTIEPELTQLETQRKQLQNATLLLTASIIGAVVLLVFLIGSQIWPLLIPLIALVIYIISKNNSTNKLRAEYRALFKNSVVEKIIHSINPSWNYDPDGKIDSPVYRNSDLFRIQYDRYNGDDLIKGVIDKTDFECSELHTEYKQVTHDSKGKRQERWVTIFRGLFFHADFNKEFSGRTYISPDVAERLLGKFGQKLQKFSGNAPLVKLENIEFEQEFVVHATDQIEARYILTPTIMEAMLRIKRRYGFDMHFSFVNSRVYCAISINKKLFEPKLFGPVVDLQEVENMHALLKLNEVIISELNLNRRIWTKE